MYQNPPFRSRICFDSGNSGFDLREAGGGAGCCVVFGQRADGDYSGVGEEGVVLVVDEV